MKRIAPEEEPTASGPEFPLAVALAGLAGVAAIPPRVGRWSDAAEHDSESDWGAAWGTMR
jgi:hypothetical protein